MNTKRLRSGAVRGIGHPRTPWAVNRIARSSTCGACRVALGFSLTEAIVTLMLVVIVAAAMSTGVAFAARQYSNSVQVSQAKILESTLKHVVENELQITNDVELGAEAPGSSGTDYDLGTFYSTNYGLNDSFSRFKNLGGKEYGEIVLASDAGERLIAPSSSYPRDLGAKIQVSCHGATTMGSETVFTLSHFHVKLEIATTAGNVLIADEFDVVPFNDISVKISE